jgi:hypothetical protein
VVYIKKANILLCYQQHSPRLKLDLREGSTCQIFMGLSMYTAENTACFESNFCGYHVFKHGDISLITLTPIRMHRVYQHEVGKQFNDSVSRNMHLKLLLC